MHCQKGTFPPIAVGLREHLRMSFHSKPGANGLFAKKSLDRVRLAELQRPEIVEMDDALYLATGGDDDEGGYLLVLH